MQRSGKDCSILLVLPAGIFLYKFVIDGEYRHVPELPHISDDTVRICNLLDVHEYVPEYPESIAEFEAPPSPESSYSQVTSGEEDCQGTICSPSSASPNSHWSRKLRGAGSFQTQHVVLNHLFLEKGRSKQSVVAFGLTHRFKSKYVTVVLYKPVKV